MWYKYEMHMHSSQGSLCAHSRCSEMVRAYHDAGYAGAVLTDHFIYGNTAVPRDLPWRERMQLYYDAYLEGKPLADELDFDLLFGIEHGYGNAKEVLLYNITVNFLKDNPDIPEITPVELARRVHDIGGYIVHAHPYRDRAYCPPVDPDLSFSDAIEVYNYTNSELANERALAAARELGFPMIVGTDNHDAAGGNVGKTALLFPQRLKTNVELAAALKACEYKLMRDGELWEP